MNIVIGSALVGIPTGWLAGSRIRIWKLFSFGTVRVFRCGKGDRVSSESKLALVAMLPVRFFCVIGLATWSVLLPCLLVDWFESQLYLAITGFVIAYLVAALYLSYRSPSPSLLIPISFLLNLALTTLGAFAYQYENDYFDGLTRPFAIACFITAFSFVLCTATRAGISIGLSKRQLSPINVTDHPGFLRQVVQDSLSAIDRLL